MAKYRQVHVSFWQDTFVLDLTPEEKYFYLYLMTNSKTSACGIYELPKKVIELETGYNRETVDKLLNRFIEYGLISYVDGHIHANFAPVRLPVREWAPLRASIFERDDFTCQYCGIRGGVLECDHIMPISRGGTNDPDNLAAACVSCNRSKSDKTLQEWRGVVQ